MPHAAERFRQLLADLDVADADYAVRLVDGLLAAGLECGASDLHLQPGATGLELRWRIDGVLQPVATVPPAVGPNVVARLKVLAELLTYRNDVPQEGRIRSVGEPLERRVSTFPTLYGEKAVVRLFAAGGRYLRLDDLGLPPDALAGLRRALAETSGAILVTGPAGSGKTTTLYACLRELAADGGGGTSIVSLEDPIEVAVAGVAQSQMNDAAGFDLATGLRFVLRQDPQAIMIGEIRDSPTAQVAFQAALTGHLVLSSFHAGSAAGAVGRLADMGIEAYLLRSGVRAILSQRLVRRLCDCARAADDDAARLGLPVDACRLPVGCGQCGGSGYRGRMLLAEMLVPGESGLGRAILEREDAAELELRAVTAGMIPLWRRACQAVEEGATSPAEVRRVLGLAGPTGSGP